MYSGEEMSVDRVFATAKPEEVFVFRHNFAENKWENVASRKDGSATVTFRKRGSAFFIRIVPDGGEKVWSTPGIWLSANLLCVCVCVCV